MLTNDALIGINNTLDRMEGFYGGLRNPLAAKPPYPKPSNLQTFIWGMHYIPKSKVCQVEYAYKNITKKL